MAIPKNRVVHVSEFLWVYGMAWNNVRFPGLKYCPSSPMAIIPVIDLFIFYKSPHFQEFGTGAQRCHQAFRQATSTETASSKDTRGRESRRLHGADTQADQWESPSCTQEVHQCYRYDDNKAHIRSITVWNSMLKTVNMCFLLDLLTPDELNTIERLTGCSAQIRPPSCRTTFLINKYRTITNVCNNRSVLPFLL